MSDLDLKRCELGSNGLHVVRAGRVSLLLCLLQAVWAAACASQPVVLTDYSAARERMVEELAAPGRGIKNRLVLNAMNTVLAMSLYLSLCASLRIVTSRCRSVMVKLFPSRSSWHS